MSMRHWVLGIITGLIAVAGCSQPQATSVVKKPSGAAGDLKVCFISNNAHEFWKLAEVGVKQAGEKTWVSKQSSACPPVAVAMNKGRLLKI